MEKIKIALTGDVLVTHRIPPYEGREDIAQLFRAHDCSIGNLETVVRRDEGHPESFPGGGYCFCTPNCLGDLRDMGFSMFSTANNHSMDYGHGALLSTIKYLDEYGFAHAGTGKDLGESARAAHFETRHGRVALLNVTSSFHDSYLAGPQNQDVKGRPGVTPLRHNALYTIPEEDFRHLERIARASGINQYHDQARKEGYLPESKHLKFGTFDFAPGQSYQVDTIPREQDLRRTVDVIKDARLDSDVVIVSVHSHQFAPGVDGKGTKHDNPQFLERFARACVDAGADIVFCHGPHCLRGVEEHNGSLILYGLGNFIFQHEGMEYLPEEIYQKYGLRRCDVTGPQALFMRRSRNRTIGLNASPAAWQSVIASVEVDDTGIVATLTPVQLMQEEVCKGFGGLPRLSDDTEIVESIIKMSEKYETPIRKVGGGIGEIRINRKNADNQRSERNSRP